MHSRSNNNIFPRFIRTFLLGLLLSVTSFAQDETTAVDSSALSGVRLPQGAHRLNDSSVPPQVGETMQKIVAEGGGKLRQGNTEVLIWTGSDLKRLGAESITDRLASALKTGGWEYEVSGTENGITFFSVLRSEPERRGILGFFGESDATLIYAWTEVHAAGGPQPSNSSTAVDSAGVSDYSFATPTGWSQDDSASKIRLTSQDGEKTLAFLPPMETSGDLQRDAERILWQVFKGHGPWAGNGFTLEYGVFERGKTLQGLEYYRAYRYAKRASDQEEYPDSRFDASILLVKLGGKVAVVVGRAPFQSDNATDSPTNAIDLLLYDLKFKSVATPYDLKREVLGSWAAASSTVAVAYTFNANGTFNKGGAISFRTSHDATRDKVTTTSYGMTDKYSLDGNVITQTYKGSGEVSKYKVRVYETKYDKDPWQSKMGFLPVANPDGGTIVFRKSN
ncbi:MAG: hypothetical protein PSX80_05195 [bacterium]|nr:hypothetical protein [bacterium]